jgi:hypothetical protein
MFGRLIYVVKVVLKHLFLYKYDKICLFISLSVSFGNFHVVCVTVCFGEYYARQRYVYVHLSSQLWRVNERRKNEKSRMKETAFCYAHSLFFFFMVVLFFELRALHLLAQCSITELWPPSQAYFLESCHLLLRKFLT